MSVSQHIGSDTELPAMSGEDRRILHEVFRHPLSHNLTWRETVALVGKLGSVEQESDTAATFRIGHERLHMHKPHTKNLTTSEMVALRHFLQRAGCVPAVESSVNDQISVVS